MTERRRSAEREGERGGVEKNQDYKKKPFTKARAEEKSYQKTQLKNATKRRKSKPTGKAKVYDKSQRKGWTKKRQVIKG